MEKWSTNQTINEGAMNIKDYSNKCRDTPRWTATAYYRTDNGIVDVSHDIMELEDLQNIIERGPDWYALDRIEITLNRDGLPALTIEQAASQ
jgi:hypothetical protein